MVRTVRTVSWCDEVNYLVTKLLTYIVDLQMNT